MGRKPLDPREVKEDSVTFRCTHKFKSRIRREAKRRGVPVSEFVHWAIEGSIEQSELAKA